MSKKKSVTAVVSSDLVRPRGAFYNGMEWLGAWLVDHCEGETITEELIHQWACQAWRAHLARHKQDLAALAKTKPALMRKIKRTLQRPNH